MKTNKEQLERAIKWCEDEVRSLKLAPTLNMGEINDEWKDCIEILETCISACKSRLLLMDYIKEITNVN